MKTLVFSDTHFTKKFDRKKFEALVNEIKKVDRIVINGDFWEGLYITFDEFLKSKWNKLFPLLKSKETIYVYGNHDYHTFSDQRVYRFCKQAVESYSLETPKQNYLFIHGNEFLFPPESKEFIETRTGKPNKLKNKFAVVICAIIQKVGFKFFGITFIPNKVNYISREKRLRIGSSNQILVCGHTHKPNYDKENTFIDIGFFNYGWANYLKINEEGDFEMISKRY